MLKLTSQHSFKLEVPTWNIELNKFNEANKPPALIEKRSAGWQDPLALLRIFRTSERRFSVGTLPREYSSLSLLCILSLSLSL